MAVKNYEVQIPKVFSYDSVRDRKIFILEAFVRFHVKDGPLTPKNPYSGRTAPLNSKRCILYIYSTNTGTEYFKRGIHFPFFFLFKMQYVS